MVAALTVVPTHLRRIRSADPNHINFIPGGYSLKCYRTVRDEDPRLMSFCLRNTFGNVALFIPLGILLPLIGTRFQALKSLLLLALSVSVTIETLQFVLRFVGNPRAVDIDDVILNTLGACVGFVIYRVVLRLLRKDEAAASSRGSGE